MCKNFYFDFILKHSDCEERIRFLALLGTDSAIHFFLFCCCIAPAEITLLPYNDMKGKDCLVNAHDDI